jgi:alpha-galactosidase
MPASAMRRNYLATGTPLPATFGWSDGSIGLTIEVDAAGTARVVRLGGPGSGPAPAPGSGPSRDGTATAGLPLVDVVLAGEGRAWSGRRYCESVAGPRLRYRGHEDRAEAGGWHELRVDLADPVTGLAAEVFYRILAGSGAMRSWVRLSNLGADPVTVESVTSFLCGLAGGPAGPEDLGGLDILWAENDWLAEGRWQRRPLRDALPDLNRRGHGADPRGRFGITSAGTWSSGTYLPMGGLVSRDAGHAWIWQIEHNGAWHWQVGEYARRRTGPGEVVGHRAAGNVWSGAYLALLGPTDVEHHWHVALEPGEAFTTVPVAVVVSDRGLEDALGRLTAYRRAIRRPHRDHRHLPVIFNDYMNTIMGEPTTARLLPLIAAAAAAGAEYFCVDAGWYAELGESWWDTVGAWRPSATRFPGGLTKVFDRIGAEGMIPGLWLEPEVVGLRSPVAEALPAEAFFTRHGRRVVENGRYHLDLRHPAAIKHLNETIDFLVGDLGAGYLKLDYNINGGPGTDSGQLSAGAGLLACNRAHLDWLDAVLDRHPGLVIENCASGGMRADYALLSRLQLQSTSDQQDYLRYPPIAAAAPAAIAPEQAAVWAYPQPGFTDDEIAFTMASAMLGRIHLSGHLDLMSPAQLALVASAVRVYKELRGDIARSVPFWPLGLPAWEDPWIALGLRGPEVSYLTVWQRGRQGADGGQARVTLPVPALRGQAMTPRIMYSGAADAEVAWDASRGVATVTLPRAPSACVLSLTPRRVGT